MTLKADYSYYPHLVSDDGKYMISCGYCYSRIEKKDGTPMDTFGRPLYRRLFKCQTFPHQIPPCNTHEEIRAFVLAEAEKLMAELIAGDTGAFSRRFEDCVYDQLGEFKHVEKVNHSGRYLTPEENHQLTQEEFNNLHRTQGCTAAVKASDERDSQTPYRESQNPNQRVDNDLSWLF